MGIEYYVKRPMSINIGVSGDALFMLTLACLCHKSHFAGEGKVIFHADFAQGTCGGFEYTPTQAFW